jgi:hypothetical protein
MMGAQDQARGGETRRGPGLWAAVLAFGLLVLMAVGSLKVLGERKVGPAEPASADPGSLVPGVLERDSDNSIDAVAVMGDRTFDGGSGEFKEADAVAIMGHCVLDLRNAQVQGDRAVIDVVAIMGHVEIIVPPDWEVTTGDMLSAGAVKNLARRTEAEIKKKVRIDGAVLMGQLDVRR